MLRAKRIVRLDALTNMLVEAQLWYMSGDAAELDAQYDPHERLPSPRVVMP